MIVPHTVFTYTAPIIYFHGLLSRLSSILLMGSLVRFPLGLRVLNIFILCCLVVVTCRWRRSHLRTIITCLG